MKVKSPSRKSLTDNAVLVGSAATGAVVSKGVVDGLVPGQKSWGKSAIAALLTAIGSASISGSGKGANVVRGLLAGMSIQQMTETITQVAQKNASTFASISNTQIKGFVNNMFELESGLAGLRQGYPVLGTSNRSEVNQLWSQPLNDFTQSATIDMTA